MEPIQLPDVQSRHDCRDTAISRVGIRGMTVPLTILGETGPQQTVATVDLSVALPASQRGTHMSRFVALIDAVKTPLSPLTIRGLLDDMLHLLEAEEGTITIQFPFFIRKTSPVSKLESSMDYRICWIADRSKGETTVTQETAVPVTSLCPCSREISAYGAHNQRSQIIIAIECADDCPSLEDQIRLAESCGSCELWSRLKRSDEKFVTEYAYDHPKFVEDAIRECAGKLNVDPRIVAYRIEVENFESIHNHSAYAWIERRKPRSIFAA